jgi:PAS domain S-box-containing protein
MPMKLVYTDGALSGDVRKTLVVEDDPMSRTILENALHERGHRIHAVGDGVEAWEILQREVYPIILLDWMLPGISGIEICRLLRAQPQGAYSTIVMVTSKDSAEDLRLALEAGADDYLVKPFGMDMLHIRIAVAEARAREKVAGSLAEEAAQASFDRYASVVGSIPDVVYQIDTKERITFIGDAVREFGYSPEELIGEPIATLLHPADAARASKAHQALLRNDSPPGRTEAQKGESFEIRVAARNNEERVARLTVISDVRSKHIGDQTATWNDDDVTGVVGVIRDITEHRNLEDRLRQSEKLEAIGKLAGGVAHDFNNQLAGIIGYAEMLAARLQDETDRKYADTILKAAQHSAHLTRQLLAFARKGKYLSVPVDLQAILREVAGLLKHSLDKRIRIACEFPEKAISTTGDPSQLQNAFLNLALNARDAMPQGGVLRFALQPVEIGREFIESQGVEIEPGSYARIVVSDTGTGMSEEIRRHIFEPFFTTKDTGKGTGMGLAAVYGTVKNHGGLILVESAPGEGTRMRVLLPLLNRERPSQEAPPADPKTEADAVHLVIDDDRTACNVLTDMLCATGGRTHSFLSAREAIEWYRGFHQTVDIVWVDMMMPEMNGADAIGQLLRIAPASRIVVVSGYGMEQQADRLSGMGVLRFVEKPFRLAEIGQIVRNLLAPGSNA